MIRVFQLIFSPTSTWQRIDLAQRSLWWVLFLSLLPLLLACSAGEGYALLRWGERRDELNRLVAVNLEQVLRYQEVHLTLGLLLVILGAKVVQWIADGFQFRVSYTAAFTTTGYALTPVFLLRLLDGFPAIPTSVCWALGAVLMVAVLYHGVGHVLKPDVSKGFGFFLLSAMVLVLLSGLAHYVAVAVLRGKIVF
jgi:hypothetical protein